MTRKLALAAAVFVVVLVALPAIAGAHVDITAKGLPSADGSVSTSVFSENECKQEFKTVELVFPAAPELSVATPSVVTGWTSTVAKTPGSEVVTGVTWTNMGSKGDATLGLEIGPIPSDAGPIEFKAIQTCDDGEIFRWVQKGESSEFPAPVLDVKQSGGDTTSSTQVPVTTTKKSSDDSNTGLIVGIAVGAIVLLGVGGALYARSKKQ